jgi:uncharacterized protein YigE (DUF2233 family)
MLYALSVIRILVFLFFASASVSAVAEPCRSETFEDSLYTVCSFDLTRDKLRMFWRHSAGEPYRVFSALQQAVAASGQTLSFAMNGGMYGDDLSPVGLYIENGRELRPANTRTVQGSPGQIPNFYKKPNGVFYLGNGNAGVAPTERFLAASPSGFATQSGRCWSSTERSTRCSSRARPTGNRATAWAFQARPTCISSSRRIG